MKRRDFLKVGTVASTGLLLPGCRPVPRVEETLFVAGDTGKEDALKPVLRMNFFKIGAQYIKPKRQLLVSPTLVIPYRHATTERPLLPVVKMDEGKPAQCLNMYEIFTLRGSSWIECEMHDFPSSPWARFRTADAWLYENDAQKHTTRRHGMVNGKHICVITYYQRYWGWVEVWQGETPEGTFKTFLMPYTWIRKSNLLYDKIVRHVDYPVKCDNGCVV